MPDSEISQTEGYIRDDTPRLTCLNRNYALNVRILKSERYERQRMQAALQLLGGLEAMSSMHVYLTAESAVFAIHDSSQEITGKMAALVSVSCNVPFMVK